jgi:HEAT repeat protein
MYSTHPNIDALVARLGSPSWSERRAVEDALCCEGPAAVAALIRALDSSSSDVRWGAVKVLGSIRACSAAPALAQALEDDDRGVRWLAAQALVRVRQPAVVAVLRRLVTDYESPWLYEGAHHVLKELATPSVTPVIRALEGEFAAITVPLAANEALASIAQAKPLPGAS